MKSMKSFLFCILVALLVTETAKGCSRISPFTFVELFEPAEAIVLATAVKYSKPPANPGMMTTGVPDSQIEFRIEEVLLGTTIPRSITLSGYLSSIDDFNDIPVPYTFVRPNGRSGSCIANTYRQGALFLLFLKKTENGYSTNLSALGPTNEQVRNADDPWVKWVKQYLKDNPKPKQVSGGGSNATSEQTAPDATELTRLLNHFLEGASRRDAAIHDRFWAEDLVYTRSAGVRIGKAQLMSDLRAAAPPTSADPTTAYSAEDTRIQQYGDTAVVAFQLVGKTTVGGRTEIARFLNTGTFLKRNGQWRAVSWQSTRVPARQESARNEVAEIEASFHKAFAAADIRTLETVLDQRFVWTQDNGLQVTREALLGQIKSGSLKYSKVETSNVTIEVYGESAVVRGVSTRQRSAIPGESGRDVDAFTAYYTVTFVRSTSGWKVVAMHSSRA